MNLRFDHPDFLLLGLLAIPLVIIGWRTLALTDHLRRITALSLRTIFLLALAFILAGPHMLREHDHLTVIGLLDISGSVRRFADLPSIADQAEGIEASGHQGIEVSGSTPTTVPALRHSNIEYLRQWFRRANQIKEPDDRFGLVVFDGRAIAISAPTKTTYVDDNLDSPIAQGTNIADAVRLGLAMFPADSAKRLVLVTDGNETAGNVREAIKQVGGSDLGFSILDFGLSGPNTANPKSKIQNPKSKIPVDVLPIAYRVTGDVQVSRVETPPTAMPGQTVTVRIILEAASPSSGSITLRREGVAVDLNGGEPGVSRHVAVPAGQSVHLAQVALGQTPINRFQAIYEPDDPSTDALPDNDRAEAFTATPSKGSVLVLDPKADQRENLLAQILNAADLPAQARPPAALPDDLLSLQNYDLIVLDNVPASAMSMQKQELLSKYVNDMGGGLIMIGGENSFGAGGWNGTPVAALLPVNLDPTKEMRLPTAALVLVLDKSGSMRAGVAGARASQQQIANESAALAIQSLRSESLVGVITFDFNPHVHVPLQRNDDPKKLMDRVRGIQAEGGTNVEPALIAALEMLKDVDVAKKRVVCMSDGRSSSTEQLDDIAKRMAAANIQLSTIAIGDDADEETMERLAELGGGTYYMVRNVRKLPQVMIDSVQVLNRPLLKDVPFVPRVLPTGSTLTSGMDRAPQLGGNVITSPRDDAKVSLEMIHPDGEPLLAHWQAGLGRVAAFTSDMNGPWSHRWNDWPNAASFWTQLARTTARPAMSRDAELIATIQDDRLNITFEMTSNEVSDENGPDGGFDYMQVDGTVYQPDGTSVPVRLRQGAPGRYEASVDATLAGNYIVALNPRRGARQLAPAIGGTSRATSAEFRNYTSNLGLLEEIVQATNGRRLDINNPAAANLFDRAGMPPSISSLPIWRMILFWAMALLLLDVACRRIAWDASLLRAAIQSAVSRVTPSYVRGNRAAATLATLRRVSDEVDVRRETDAAGLEQFQTTGIIAPPPERAMTGETSSTGATSISQPDPSARFDAAAPPDESKVTAALDALLGRGKPSQRSQASPTSDQSTPEPGITAAETTGNLLAAKRRARKQMQGDSDEAINK